MSVCLSAAKLVVVGILMASCSSALANPFLAQEQKQVDVTQKELSVLRQEIERIKAEVGALSIKKEGRLMFVPEGKGAAEGDEADDVLVAPGEPSAPAMYEYDPEDPTVISDGMIPEGFIPFMEINGRYLLRNEASESGLRYITVSQKAYYQRLMPINGSFQESEDE